MAAVALSGCCHHSGFNACCVDACWQPPCGSVVESCTVEEPVCPHYGYGWPRGFKTPCCWEDDPCRYAIPDCSNWNNSGGCGGCTNFLASLFGHKRCRCSDYADCCNPCNVCPMPLVSGVPPTPAPKTDTAKPEYDPIPEPADPKDEDPQPATLMAPPPRTRPLSGPVELDDSAQTWQRTRL
jgi:hypothetical protein